MQVVGLQPGGVWGEGCAQPGLKQVVGVEAGDLRERAKGGQTGQNSLSGQNNVGPEQTASMIRYASVCCRV